MLTLFNMEKTSWQLCLQENLFLPRKTTGILYIDKSHPECILSACCYTNLIGCACVLLVLTHNYAMIAV